ncbi:septum site-determining protein Ssd [uncultured Williamsia sp.]|uniref:septum site-determining protein Ssd n=1 Tax=uncultured Williamsia sp. TaxID=259311 RepID=UPI002630526F|nr:septum site-determining protein Ssd [uncultured Williamsia sp.]
MTNPSAVGDLLVAMVDESLLDDVTRCAAAAGYRVVAADPATGRRAWTDATAVVLDPSSAAAVADAGWPRRAGVVVVGPGPLDADLWRAAVRLGAEDAHVLPDADHAVVGVLSRLRLPHRGAGVSVAVVGGHGGAGASVLAAAVATRAAEDLAGDTLLLDLDDLGGGVDLILGIEESGGLRWPELTVDSGQVVAASLHAALPRSAAGVTVLAPRRGVDHVVTADSARAVLEAACAAGGTVVVDLSRRVDDVARAVVEVVDLVVVVTTATVRGCAATCEMSGRWQSVTDRSGLVVRGPAPGGLGASVVASTVGLELLAAVRSDPRVVHGLESGRLPLARRSSLSRAADTVLDRVLDLTAVGA